MPNNILEWVDYLMNVDGKSEEEALVLVKEYIDAGLEIPEEDYEDGYLEEGFDPYAGCYSYDC